MGGGGMRLAIAGDRGAGRQGMPAPPRASAGAHADRLEGADRAAHGPTKRGHGGGGGRLAAHRQRCAAMG